MGIHLVWRKKEDKLLGLVCLRVLVTLKNGLVSKRYYCMVVFRSPLHLCPHSSPNIFTVILIPIWTSDLEGCFGNYALGWFAVVVMGFTCGSDIFIFIFIKKLYIVIFLMYFYSLKMLILNNFFNIYIYICN